MIHYTKLMIAATLIASISGGAQAENNRGERPERPSFSSLDINEDGEISFDEFSSHDVPHGDHQTIFDHIDTDGDGIITSDEFENHTPPQRQRRQEERS